MKIAAGVFGRRPTEKDQSSYLVDCKGFNYEAKYVGATSGAPFTDKKVGQMREYGFLINHRRMKVGSGRNTFLKGKELLQNWGHLQLGWAFVDPRTKVEPGHKFGLCVREAFAWLINPLQIVYVVDDHAVQEEFLRPLQGSSHSMKNNLPILSDKIAYTFGSGTLQGHLLAGEERFSVEWNQADDSVWYEIFSFSKPAHILSIAGFPIVRFQQSLFAKQSCEAMVNRLRKV